MRLLCFTNAALVEGFGPKPAWCSIGVSKKAVEPPKTNPRDLGTRANATDAWASAEGIISEANAPSAGCRKFGLGYEGGAFYIEGSEDGWGWKRYRAAG